MLKNDAQVALFLVDQVGTERFDKEYAYSIRHNYGKEGKRTVRSIFFG